VKWVCTNSDGNHYTEEKGQLKVEYCGPKGWVATSKRGQRKEGFAVRASAKRHAESWEKK
jgi:hypothetical protein